MNQHVTLEDSQIKWVEYFENEKNRLLSVIESHIKGIEHIGSTSIAGLAAKPIIDIMVAVETLDCAEACIQSLEALGYHHVLHAEFPERRFFWREANNGQRFHLHFYMYGSKDWQEKRLFRDYLKKHEDALHAYEALKRALALTYKDDRSAYTEAKGPFIRTIIEKAKNERIEWQQQVPVQGLNHLLFSVSDLDQSVAFYQDVFGARLLVKGRTTAYFDLNGIWLALNVETDIPRREIHHSYTHLAFTIKEVDFDQTLHMLQMRGVHILPGRERDQKDKKSIYFTDPDGHKFEFHTGSLQDRMSYYQKEKAHMTFY